MKTFKRNNFIMQTQESVTPDGVESGENEKNDFSSSEESDKTSRTGGFNSMRSIGTLSKVRVKKPVEMRKSYKIFDEVLKRKSTFLNVGNHSEVLERSFRVSTGIRAQDSRAIATSRGFYEAEDAARKKEVQEKKNKAPNKLLKTQNTASYTSLFASVKNFFL